MDRALALLPPTDKGYLPYYLLLAAVAAIGNALQNLTTLHYTRRIYNGKFVPNSTLPKATGKASPEDSIAKVIPATSGKDSEKAQDQVSPLAARLFGTYTFVAGVIRLYACYRLDDPAFYQLGIWTHVIAAVHFTSELLVYKTIKFSGPQIMPFAAAYVGSVWMFLQYDNYVTN